MQGYRISTTQIHQGTKKNNKKKTTTKKPTHTQKKPNHSQVTTAIALCLFVNKKVKISPRSLILFLGEMGPLVITNNIFHCTATFHKLLWCWVLNEDNLCGTKELCQPPSAVKEENRLRGIVSQIFNTCCRTQLVRCSGLRAVPI